MKNPSDLFQLIKSLSKSEKRYFKIYASRHVIGEQNNYIKLFDAIDRQKEYDEDAIRKEFASEVFIKQLSVTKNYLYRLILESMRAYHAERTPRAQVRGLLNDADFLIGRRLFEQADKIIDKARKTAQANEEYILLLETMTLERTVMREIRYEDQSQEDIDRFYSSFLDTLSIVDNVARYWQLSAVMYLSYVLKGSTRDASDYKQLEELLSHPLLASDDQALTFEARQFYYHIHSTYNFIRGDYKAAHASSMQLITLLESRPQYLLTNTLGYLGIITNFLIDSFYLGYHDEFFEKIRSLRTLTDVYPELRTEPLEAEIFKNTYNLELFAYTDIGDYEKGLQLVGEIESGLERYGEYIDGAAQLTFYYNLATLHFIAEKYGEALKWINVIINETDAEVREDVDCFARIFSLIIHFELGNYDLLEYLLKSTYRYLYKRNRLYQFESVVLRFIRKLTRVHTRDQLLALFAEVREELQPLAEDPLEKKAFEFFHPLLWLESKIERRKFADLVRKSSRQAIHASPANQA